MSRKLINSHKITHGLSKTKTYKVWCDMKRRCSNPKDKKSKLHYQDKGISVCEKWLTFEGFFEDMGHAPDGSPSLDRIDNNRGYYKENCRWVSRSVQVMNRSKRKGASSNYRGVCFKKAFRKYGAAITVDGKLFHIGYFETEIAAATAYNEAAIKLYGELACLNQIP